jgi:methionyl-tRNA synthetase
MKVRAAGFTFSKVCEQQFCGSCQRFLADRLVYGQCPLCGYDKAKGDQCDGCTKLMNATELIGAKCKTCDSKPEIRQSEHIFIDLEKITPELKAWVDKTAKEGFWTSNSATQTNALIAQGLPGRCITRDLKWGTPVPLDEFKSKVFYVWFDAPIGYISITANYTDEWEKWWKNPSQVESFQFMGKDNITFHTVIFPSTLIATRENYTKLHHISTTEFLNYEDIKFSKTNSTGVFGDDAKNSGIPAEVWRFYLLINRPETADTAFLWKDF